MAAVPLIRPMRAPKKGKSSKPQKTLNRTRATAAKRTTKTRGGKTSKPGIKKAAPKVKRGAKSVVKAATAATAARKSSRKTESQRAKATPAHAATRVATMPAAPLEIIAAQGDGKGRIPTVVIKPVLPSLMTLDQVAEMLGVSKVTVRRWTTKKILSCIRIGSRKDRRFRRTEVEKWLKSCIEKAQPAMS